MFVKTWSQVTYTQNSWTDISVAVLTGVQSSLLFQKSQRDHSKLIQQICLPQGTLRCHHVHLGWAFVQTLRVLCAREDVEPKPVPIWTNTPGRLPLLAPGFPPANRGHRRRHFSMNLDGHSPQLSGRFKYLGPSFPVSPGRLWERQKSQLPQFPNMSSQVPALCATSAPLHVDERCFEGGHISFYYYFVIHNNQSPRVLSVVA